MRVKGKVGNRNVEAVLRREGEKWKVKIGDREWEFDVRKSPVGGFFKISSSEGDHTFIPYAFEGNTAFFKVDSNYVAFEFRSPELEAEESDMVKIYTAPFSGLIRKIHVKKGEKVKKGQVLFEFEAMKMVSEIKSEIEGVVTEIWAKDGQNVASGDKILKVELDSKER